MNFYAIQKTTLEKRWAVFYQRKFTKPKLALLCEVEKYPELINFLPFSGNCLSEVYVLLLPGLRLFLWCQCRLFDSLFWSPLAVGSWSGSAGLDAPQLVDDITDPLLEDNPPTDGSFTSMTDTRSEACSSATSGLVSLLLAGGFRTTSHPTAGLASPLQAGVFWAKFSPTTGLASSLLAGGFEVGFSPTPVLASPGLAGGSATTISPTAGLASPLLGCGFEESFSPTTGLASPFLAWGFEVSFTPKAGLASLGLARGCRTTISTTAG